MLYLEQSQIPDSLRQGYAGRKFAAEVCESLSIPFNAGLWHGGSRTTYSAINLATGDNVPMTGESLAPWDTGRKSHKVLIPHGVAIVAHSIFCGKDMGLTFYLRPENAASLFPSPVTLSPLESLILNATAMYKSSYMGRDRYEMAKEDSRYGKKETPFPTRQEWDQAKAGLIAKGLLTKASAITPKGRNAI